MKEKQIAKIIIDAFWNGGKVIIFGCGGSMAEASHFAGELVGIGVPAIALNDPSVLTALANDFRFDEVFSRQIFTLGKTEDIAIALSTSGKSKSVLNGIKMAEEVGVNVIDWPRKGKTTEEIQEYQLGLIHKVYHLLKEL